MNLQEVQFLTRMADAAKQAGHVFPEMASCEAALESGFGKSGLASLDNNLFGMKQHKHPVYGTVVLPTREFVGKDKDTQDGCCDGWITVQAQWVKYPDYAACFRDRMSTLTRLAPEKGFEHYQAALDAKDPETYVREVSAKWSTDPGWRCSCGQEFLRESDAKAHATTVNHVIASVLGLGRALKVLGIYREFQSLQGVGKS